MISLIKGFLDQRVVLRRILSNLEGLLILEEDTDSPKEYKALILTILTKINVILEKYESVKAWTHSNSPTENEEQTETDTCLLNDYNWIWIIKSELLNVSYKLEGSLIYRFGFLLLTAKNQEKGA